MHLGKKPPLIIWNGGEVQLPALSRGGRKEKFNPIGKVFYTNIHDERIFNPSLKYDFIAEYEWDRMDAEYTEILINIKNNADTINLYPNADVKAFRVPVVITDFQIPSSRGFSYMNGVIMKCAAVSPRKKIPSMNNLYVGKLPTRISIIN